MVVVLVGVQGFIESGQGCFNDALIVIIKGIKITVTEVFSWINHGKSLLRSEIGH